MNLDLNKICDIELDGLDASDWPDLCDAYISRAFLKLDSGQFRELTEEELEWLQENRRDWYYDYIYSHAADYLF